MSVAFHDLEEMRVMVNLLHSEMTNAHFIDIQNVAQKSDVAEVKQVLTEMLTKEGLMELFLTVEKPIITILEEMQKVGITLDVKKLSDMSKELHAQVKVLEKKIHTLAGVEFNIASPKQLGDVLYDTLNLGSKIQENKDRTKKY